MAFFRAQHSPGILSRGTLGRRTFAVRCHPTITFAQNVHHSRNFRKPHQRRRPPDLARQLDCRIRAAVASSIAHQKLHFFHQVVVRQAQQLRHAGSSPRQKRASLARAAPFRPCIHSPAKSFFPSSQLPHPDFLPSMVTTLPRSFSTPFSAGAGMRITSSNNPVIAVRNSSMSVKRSLV